ncbi:Glutathione S-transferase theta-1 [Orobanche hederae]
MTLKVYADRMSQPSRAVIIFCREINPMRKVPAIVDGRFKLIESHAILIYLACVFPGVADHCCDTA